MSNFKENCTIKTIMFRSDSSSSIGTGHIMRDLVLADKLQKTYNAKILFACIVLKGNIIDKIPYEVKILKSHNNSELESLIKKLNIDMLVFDHYEIDYNDEKYFKEKNKYLTILSLDDMYKKHYSDIVLNHNIYAKKQKYKGLVPAFCEVQCGSTFTLLREEFLLVKQSTQKTLSLNEKFIIFLAMGGSDHSDINLKILEVLSSFTDIKVHLLTTNANANLKKLQEYVKNRSWISLHLNSNSVAELMYQSNLAIITPSVIMNEVHFMQLPFIAIQTADNQHYMSSYLQENGYSILNTFDRKTLEEKLCKHLLLK